MSNKGDVRDDPARVGPALHDLRVVWDRNGTYCLSVEGRPVVERARTRQEAFVRLAEKIRKLQISECCLAPISESRRGVLWTASCSQCGQDWAAADLSMTHGEVPWR
jgi:hypothetical protein